MAFVGTGSTSNYVTGALSGLSLTSQFSDWPLNGALTLFGWVRLRATGGTEQLFSITNGPSASVRVVINTNTGGVLQSQVATTLTASTATGAALTLSEWTPVMATLHESGGQMYTTLYQGASTYSVNRASAAANFTNVGIGVRVTTSVTAASANVDLAECAVWYGHLGAADFERLSRGACPASVATPRLIRYYPLRGDLQDYGPTQQAAMQTGAYDITWTDHPPVEQYRPLPLVYIAAGYPPLAADVGTFALTGQAVALKFGRVLSLGLSSYTLTGQAVALRAARRVTLDPGTYALSGQAIALSRGRVPLGLSTGTFALTGQDVGLRAGRLITPETGYFTITGPDVTMAYSAAPAPAAVGGLGRRRKGARRVYLREPIEPLAPPATAAKAAMTIRAAYDDDDEAWILLQ